MKHALGILTYAPHDADQLVLDRLPTALRSLEASGYDGPVSIIDDGSAHRDHLNFLDRLGARYTVVRRYANGGICRAKNTCIRVLMEHRIDVGWIAEDDIEFRPGWHRQYLAAHEAIPNLHHLSWAWDDDPSGRMKKTRTEINGFPIVRTSRLNGVFLTFTPKVVEVVGGFRMLPEKWGHTHTNWTRRIVHAGLAPFYADVVDSNQFLACGAASVVSTVSTERKRRCDRRNRRAALEVQPTYCPLTE